MDDGLILPDNLQTGGGLPPGWFNDAEIAKYRVLVAQVPDHGLIVEVGSYLGRSICSVLPDCIARGINVWCVDLWPDIRVYHLFLANFATHTKYALTIKRMDSSVAAREIGSGVCDLVFIDADHTEDAVRRDLEAWLPKVRSGGIIAGHDFDPYAPPERNNGVHLAVRGMRSELTRELKVMSQWEGTIWWTRVP